MSQYRLTSSRRNGGEDALARSSPLFLRPRVKRVCEMFPLFWQKILVEPVGLQGPILVGIGPEVIRSLPDAQLRRHACFAKFTDQRLGLLNGNGRIFVAVDDEGGWIVRCDVIHR